MKFQTRGQFYHILGVSLKIFRGSVSEYYPIIALNAKLKRRFGQTGGHDQRQVNEARRSYKM